jgi:predicted lipopolysaccharide heptosyltransferase III
VRRSSGWAEPPAPIPSHRIENARRVLVIRLRALGDVVLALPVLGALRERFPGAHLAMAVDEAWAPVLEGNPDVDQVITLSRVARKGLFRGARRDLGFLREIRRGRFDLVVDLFGNPRSALATFLSGAPVRVGYDFRGRRYAYTHRQPRDVLTGGEPIMRYAADVNLAMVKPLGVVGRASAARILLRETERHEAARILQELGVDPARERVVALLPAGSWPAKTWPRERFVELGEILARREGTRVLLLWGPGEETLAREVAGRMRESALIAPPLPLRHLFALLASVDLFIGNDSGPKHLAAAVGTPTIAVFGPTDRRTWTPAGEEHVAIQHEVPCGPCNRRTCDDLRCLWSVTARNVARRAEEMLARLPPRDAPREAQSTGTS